MVMPINNKEIYFYKPNKKQTAIMFIVEEKLLLPLCSKLKK